VPEGSAEFVANFDFLRFCGDEGNRWLQQFQAGRGIELTAALSMAVKLLQRHEISPAQRLLSSVDEALLSADEPPSIVDVVRRWYFTSKAYLDYLCEDLPSARRSLQQARRHVETLISRHTFMTPIAVHCTDVRVQTARVARRENCWDEVVRVIEEIKETYAGTLPFCVLESGKAIGMVDVRDFYRSLPLSGKYERAAQFALDEGYPHHEWIDRLEDSIYALPDFVIPYP